MEHFIAVLQGPWLNIEMPSCQYSESSCGDKTVIRSFNFYNGNSYTGNTISLYWINPEVSSLARGPSLYDCTSAWDATLTLEWRHNGRDAVSNHQPHDCLLNRLLRRRRKHQSSAPLAFVRGIHRGPVNSPHKWPVTRKMFQFDDVIMK